VESQGPTQFKGEGKPSNSSYIEVRDTTSLTVSRHLLNSCLCCYARKPNFRNNLSNCQSRICKTNRFARCRCLLFMLLVLRQFWQVLKKLFLKLGWYFELQFTLWVLCTLYFWVFLCTDLKTCQQRRVCANANANASSTPRLAFVAHQV
jgi:hypothetical protein